MTASGLIDAVLAWRENGARLDGRMGLVSPSLLGLVMLVLDKFESLRCWLAGSLKELAALEVVEAQKPRLILVPVVSSTELELTELAMLLLRECCALKPRQMSASIPAGGQSPR